jgi:hypothetical protein
MSFDVNFPSFSLLVSYSDNEMGIVISEKLFEFYAKQEEKKKKKNRTDNQL